MLVWKAEMGFWAGFTDVSLLEVSTPAMAGMSDKATHGSDSIFGIRTNAATPTLL